MERSTAEVKKHSKHHEVFINIFDTRVLEDERKEEEREKKRYREESHEQLKHMPRSHVISPEKER